MRTSEGRRLLIGRSGNKYIPESDGTKCGLVITRQHGGSSLTLDHVL